MNAWDDAVAAVLAGDQRAAVVRADCLDFLRSLPADSVDLVFGSPPYEAARLYLEDGVDQGIARGTDAWVAWMVDVFAECRRVCKGVVAFVVEGQTKKYRYSCGPVLLMAELCRRGFVLRKPPIFHRVGIPGSGGPDWLRNDYEFIVCTTRGGRLPWSDNTAMGHPPKWAPGGEMSHRLSDGTRRNQCGRNATTTDRKADGSMVAERESGGELVTKKRRITSGHKDGDTPNDDTYAPPVLANPGNVIKLAVGGGLLGNELAHLNEAPFPEKLAEFFVLSFAAPGSVCLDCFSGSGTTAAVAQRHGRRGLACDVRQSQVDLTRRRLLEETPQDLLLGDLTP